MTFDEAFKLLIGHEGGHVNDARDPGGETKFGISKRVYPFEDIRNLTIERARAIYYRVPCSGETGDIPEDMDLLTVRVVGLPQGTVYQPPTAAIPVQLQIDAPASALKNPPLLVEVGVDRNRDRELRGDETLTLSVDRHVEAALVGVTKTGELQIATTVSDFTLAVPAGVDADAYQRAGYVAALDAARRTYGALNET